MRLGGGSRTQAECFPIRSKNTCSMGVVADVARSIYGSTLVNDPHASEICWFIGPSKHTERQEE